LSSNTSDKGRDARYMWEGDDDAEVVETGKGRELDLAKKQEKKPDDTPGAKPRR
jgi:hypothetical protein